MAQAGAKLRIGVDTGGTFTDLVLDPGSGAPLVTHKLLSTPDDPARAVLQGIAEVLAKWRALGGPVVNATHDPPAPGNAVSHDAPAVSRDAGGGPDAIQPWVIHGSTVATNALLEGKGARAAFVTTRGFEDTLFLARQNRPALYDLEPVKPAPPIAPECCLGLTERLAYDGAVLTPLDPAELADLPGRLVALGVEAVAVSLLHSYANPAHEAAVAGCLRAALPGVHLTVSSELLPEIREYERAATCLANAVVAPPMLRYLTRLGDALGPERLRIMGSGGGTLPLSAVAARPVLTLLSGPAGGVAGALAAAQAGGAERIIGFDMGGTSTDVALCEGRPSVTTESEVAGLPVRLPFLAIHTVGAGGGSIARLDPGGALTVGPDSMGADPGPACYGRQPAGSLTPTVTDAHVVLGHLTPERPLGGGLRLAPHAALDAVTGLARAAGLTPEECARGILRVAETAMARAIQRVSLERGHDPRGFTLVPFGGAGGLHACRLAELLGIRQVLVPQNPGLLSALGMLASPPLYTFSQGVMLTLEPQVDPVDSAGGTDSAGPPLAAHPALAPVLARLVAMGEQALHADGVPPHRQVYRIELDLRYTGQSYELTVQLAGDPLATFVHEHQRLYGYTSPGRPVEVVAARLTATAEPPRLSFPTLPPRECPAAQQPREPAATQPSHEHTAIQPTCEHSATQPSHEHKSILPPCASQPDESRPFILTDYLNKPTPIEGPALETGLIYGEDGWVEAAFVNRADLLAGDVLRGPLVVSEYSATTFVPPGWTLAVNHVGQLVLRVVATFLSPK